MRKTDNQAFAVARPVSSTGLVEVPYDAILIPGTRFELDGLPGPNMWQRLLKGWRRTEDYPNASLIATGSWRGVEDYLRIDPNATEATEIRKWLMRWGVDRSRILIDPHAQESLGNLILPILAFSGPLCWERLLVPTQGWHATRLQRFWDHMNPGNLTVTFDWANCQLDAQKREKNVWTDVTKGTLYFEEFQREKATRGSLEEAFYWMQRKGHYKGIRLDDVVADLRSQLPPSVLASRTA